MGKITIGVPKVKPFFSLFGGSMGETVWNGAAIGFLL
jgi:hypothetical protein